MTAYSCLIFKVNKKFDCFSDLYFWHRCKWQGADGNFETANSKGKLSLKMRDNKAIFCWKCKGLEEFFDFIFWGWPVRTAARDRLASGDKWGRSGEYELWLRVWGICGDKVLEQKRRSNLRAGRRDCFAQLLRSTRLSRQQPRMVTAGAAGGRWRSRWSRLPKPTRGAAGWASCFQQRHWRGCRASMPERPAEWRSRRRTVAKWRLGKLSQAGRFGVCVAASRPGVRGRQLQPRAAHGGCDAWGSPLLVVGC